MAFNKQFALLLAVLALAVSGCDFGPDARPAPRAAAPPDPSSMEFQPPAHEPSINPADSSGRTPEQVALYLIDARNERDWKTTYSLYATPSVEFEIAEREWAAADERISKFVVHERRIIDHSTAYVRVSYESTPTPLGGMRRDPVVVSPPGEWWPMYKAGGRWKVKWLPRQ